MKPLALVLLISLFGCYKQFPIDIVAAPIPSRKVDTPKPTPKDTTKPVVVVDTTRKPKRIIWFGDSITEGVASSDRKNKSYAGLVSAYYGAEDLNYGFSGSCVNPINGYQGTGGYNFIDRYPLANTGDFSPGNYVCTQYGTNDLPGNYGAPDRIPAWISSYDSILQNIVAFGYRPDQIIVMTEPYEGSVRPSNFLQPLKDLCAQRGYRFFNTWNYTDSVGWVIGVDTEPDAIHPWDAGHQKIANGLIQYINTF